MFKLDLWNPNFIFQEYFSKNYWSIGQAVRVFAWVQSRVESYQRLKKWYLMPPCLTLSIIRYGSRVKWSNPGNGVAPSPTPRCGSYWKGNLQVILDYGHQLYLLTLVKFKIDKDNNNNLTRLFGWVFMHINPCGLFNAKSC